MQMTQPICGTKVVLPTQSLQPNPNETRWAVLVDLVQARATFGLNDRDLAVLRGLISCLSKTDLSKTFVFASNITLSKRTDGMNERTLRRHLAKLIAAGLITRHSSPNGKRYMRRNHLGEAAHAFGFDLAPLFTRHPEINAAATASKVETDTIAALREEISLLRQSLIETSPALADGARKILRRNLGADALRAFINTIKSQMTATDIQISAPTMTASDGHFVRHIHKSIKEIKESEECCEEESQEKATPITRVIPTKHQNTPALAHVIAACPTSCNFAYEPLETWPDLIRFTEVLAPMLRIDRGLMDTARRAMGAVAAAVTVMCILQMGEKVRSAGAYLRSLTKRAVAGQFSTTTMVNALLSGQTACGAGG